MKDNKNNRVVFEPGSPEFSGPAASKRRYVTPESTRGEPDRGLYVETTVRPYEQSDFKALAAVYKAAFAEPPWNEYMKCGKCGVGYGKAELREGCTYDKENVKWSYLELKTGKGCKDCGTDLSPWFKRTMIGGFSGTSKDLVPFWTDADIKQDLDYACSQQKPITLVAENAYGFQGFSWGYQLPLEKFSFLEGIVSPDACYMDEIAVAPDARKKGIGACLGEEFENKAYQKGIPELVLRTDRRNTASMALFKALGYSPVKNSASPDGCMYDPEYPDRIYLTKLTGLKTE